MPSEISQSYKVPADGATPSWWELDDGECHFCRGHGMINTRPGNDPMDDGEDCPICKGTGVNG